MYFVKYELISIRYEKKNSRRQLIRRENDFVLILIVSKANARLCIYLQFALRENSHSSRGIITNLFITSVSASL